MSLNNNKVSQAFLYVSIALWVASLALPALIFLGNDRIVYGVVVLLEGWAGFLNGSFAWAGNFFFIYCIFSTKILRITPLIPAILAALFAASTFLFQESASMNIGSLRLYGFGIGAYIWLIAISCNLLAASLRRLENKCLSININILMRDVFSLSAIILIIFYSLLFLINGVIDHLKASIAEEPYLGSSIYKRGKVCELPDIKSNQKIILNEPLQIMVTGNHVAPYDDVLSHPSTLLAWGVPTVRRKGFDYSLQNKNDVNSVVITPATGETSTRLSINYTVWGIIEAKLTKVETHTEVVAFDARWENKEMKDVYCPQYIDNTHQTENPLKNLIATSLIAADKSTFEHPNKNNQTSTPPKKLTVTSQKTIGKLSKLNLNKNISCPENTGLLSVIDKPDWHTETSNLDIRATYIFQQGNKIFPIDYLPGFYLGNTIACKDDSVYFLLTTHISNLANHPDDLLIQKRGLDNLNAWRWYKGFQLNHYALGINDADINYKLLSIEENDNNLTIKIAAFSKDITDGDIIEIRAK